MYYVGIIHTNKLCLKTRSVKANLPSDVGLACNLAVPQDKAIYACVTIGGRGDFSRTFVGDSGPEHPRSYNEWLGGNALRGRAYQC